MATRSGSRRTHFRKGHKNPESDFISTCANGCGRNAYDGGNCGKCTRKRSAPKKVIDAACCFQICTALCLLFTIIVAICALVWALSASRHATEIWEMIENEQVCGGCGDDYTECHAVSTPYWGFDRNNSKWNRCDPYLTQETVPYLDLKCQAYVGLDQSGIPSISCDGIAYFPTWNGYLFAMEVETCNILWNLTIESITNVTGDVARVTPAIHGDSLILGGGQGGLNGQNPAAYLFSIDRWSREINWVRLMDDHPFAVITTSVIVERGRVFGGVSSREEAAAAFVPNYPCCSFRGSAFSLDADTGDMIWKFYTAPVNMTGNAVWGSSFVLDWCNRKVYLTTGNNYVEDEEITACLEALPEDATKEDIDECLRENNEINAIIALDLYTGEKIWSNRVTGPDAWNVACLIPDINPANCPENPGPDYDFGQSPMRWTLYNQSAVYPEKKYKDVVGAGQKSGIFFTLDSEDGSIVWTQFVGPGSALGGMQWGSAVDDKCVYVSNANRNFMDWIHPNGTIFCGGAWACLNKNTGWIEWITPDPFSVSGEEECQQIRDDQFPDDEDNGPPVRSVHTKNSKQITFKQHKAQQKQRANKNRAAVKVGQASLYARTRYTKQSANPSNLQYMKNLFKDQRRSGADSRTRNAPGHGEGPLSYSQGSPSIVNDVPFFGSMTGHIYALRKEDGQVIWNYDVGGSINSSPSFYKGHMVVLSGYQRFGLGPNQTFVHVFNIGGDLALPTPLV
jgi:polyvinyl alcohol dehydrogenase (cytochrome)